ncbi:DUF663 domain-containing protein [Naegleria gruberi]|uniref:DUF663 domain-containing protein n=1 Tax=Naegleria gruberi TaxID=5762 RepID=D2V9Z5_NAEGR|nr:DUF663 domain-containing protein [Naegleria gruberi]EFC46221.1 DUF663 domain-containing protein [Naegleria gruberi]|eukprot:XP_002678965.1 DUF663 domain-containing protein [Naegleria gruberi strain NEG-M]
MSTHHRSSSLHQENKKHKSKHISKRQLKKESKGRVEHEGGLKASQMKKTHQNAKAQRKQRAKQVRDNKKQQILYRQRLGRSGNPPRIVSVMSLSGQDEGEVESVFSDIMSRSEEFESGKINLNDLDFSSVRSIRLQKEFQQKSLTLFCVKQANSRSVLDAAKVSDIMIFVLPAQSIQFNGNQEPSLHPTAKYNLSLLRAQGLPSSIVVLQGLNQISQKKQNDVKQVVNKIMKDEIPDFEKVFSLTSTTNSMDDSANFETTKTEMKQILLRLNSLTPKTIYWRENHPYMIVENLEFIKKDQSEINELSDENSNNGTLVIRGYLRGKPASPNQLFHLVNYGTYQLDKIVLEKENSHAYSKKKQQGSSSNAMEDDKVGTSQMSTTADSNEPKTLLPDEKQESLQTALEPNLMDGEQTLPTKEDYEMELANQITEKQAGYVYHKKVVPKGMTPTEAAWIIDHLEDAEEDQSDEEEDEMIDEANRAVAADEEERRVDFNFDIASEAQTHIEKHFNLDEMDEDMTEEERIAEMMRAIKSRKEMKNEMDYPDEVDTPLDIPARVRFQKYRGLKSFRSSPWDAEENLPLDYSRIFRFKNFQTSQKLALEGFDPENDYNLWENYITLHIANVPANMCEVIQQKKEPLIVFGLLKHEQKTSLVHLLVKRTNDSVVVKQSTSYDPSDNITKMIEYHPQEDDDGEEEPIPGAEVEENPIKSKDELIIQIGFRTFKCNPIYSEHNPRNDKHKYERFFAPYRFLIATVYAPVTFKPAPVLMFRRNNKNTMSLVDNMIVQTEPSQTLDQPNLDFVGHGTVHGVDPYRRVIKKIILTGHPYKLHKNQVVARYMFFNPEDIRWFKPVEVYTKYGRHGIIKEAVGTHGYMRCLFDDIVLPKDTICMNLYKRVFPKWTTESSSLLAGPTISIPRPLKQTTSSGGAYLNEEAIRRLGIMSKSEELEMIED